MNSLSDSIPRKKKAIEANVAEADRLHGVIEESLEIKYRSYTEKQRRELVGKERPCQVLRKEFIKKFGAKVATEILNPSTWLTCGFETIIPRFTKRVTTLYSSFTDMS